MYRKGLFDTLLITDLEGELFQSKGQEPKGFHPMAEASSGRVIGWATDEQAQRWDDLKHEAYCIGFTSFSEAQVGRVTGWDPLHEHQLMFADHGMTLLYRNLNGLNKWEAIPEWSQPYLEHARASSRALQQDGARLYFAMMRDLPEMAQQHHGKMIYPKLPIRGAVDGMYYAIQAGSFIQSLMQNGREDKLVQFKKILAEHLDWCDGRYSYFEFEGTFAFMPAWASRQAVLQRFLSLVGNREAYETVDPRLSLALRDIGTPKVILAGKPGSTIIGQTTTGTST